jgi:hypothetical protein
MIAQAAAPRIHFSDLESGPNTGGENNKGAYVTIYGVNFGSTRGSSTVTVGGGEVAGYPIWTDTKIAFQLGANAKTGSIVVHNSAGTSNGVPFTVRAGAIRFVAVSGNNASSGDFATPWKTIQYAVNTIAAGDIIYVMNGVREFKTGSSNGSVEIRRSGEPGKPMALLGYPGAVAIIGSKGTSPCAGTDCINGLKTFNISVAYHHWVVANMHLEAQNAALVVTGAPVNGSTNWRIVGNDMTCPLGQGQTACLATSQVQGVKVYGNNVHDAGLRGTSTQQYYHGVYFGTDTNHVDMGWNRVTNVGGCRAVHVHSSQAYGGGSGDPTGRDQYDLSIHDNVILDAACDSIILATVDPSKGKVEVFNNVIARGGAGPRPPAGGGNFSCVYVAGYTNGGTPGRGVVEVYNNTTIDCGNIGSEGNAFENGGNNPNLTMNMVNNLMFQTSGLYVDPGGITGSNNQMYGNGSASSVLFGTKMAGSPQFANPSADDYHIPPSSPSADAGKTIASLTYDLDGVARPQGSGYSVGAYEPVGGSSAPPALTSLNCVPPALTGVSSSACTVSLNKAAGGTVVVDLDSSSTSLSVPPSVSIPSGSASASFTANSSAVGSVTNVVITASYNGESETFPLVVNPPASSGPALASLTCNPAAITGAGSTNCTAALTAPATSAESVQLTSDHPALVVPPSAGIASGAASATFEADASEVTGQVVVNLTASLDGVSKTFQVTLKPVATPDPVLVSVALSPTSMTGAGDVSGTVTASDEATAPMVIALKSGTGSLTLPASVTIPVGANKASFIAKAAQVTATTAATVTASYAGVSKTGTVTLNPPPTGSGVLANLVCNPQAVKSSSTTSCTVSLSGPAGASKLIALTKNNGNVSMPSSVTIATGGTSATFQVRIWTIPSPVIVNITASNGGVSKTYALYVNQPAPPPPGTPSLALSDFRCANTTPATPSTTTCSVTLNGVVKGSPAMVALTKSDSDAVSTPGSVAVPVGASSASFTVQVWSVPAGTVVTLRASYGSVTKQVILNLK